LADAKIEDFNFKNKKSHVDKIYSFQLLAHFLTDLESPEIKFLNLDLNVHIYLYKNYKILFLLEKNNF
jgi:hypothetical protein